MAEGFTTTCAGSCPIHSDSSHPWVYTRAVARRGRRHSEAIHINEKSPMLSLPGPLAVALAARGERRPSWKETAELYFAHPLNQKKRRRAPDGALLPKDPDSLHLCC